MSRPSRSIVRWAVAPLIVSVAIAVLLVPGQAEAQTCPLALGCTSTTQQTIPFAATEQSLWGPQGGEALLEGVTVTLFDEIWGESGEDSSNQSFDGWWGNWDFGGSVSASTSGRIASYFDVNEFGRATVDIDYPVRVEVTVPEANTFRAGDQVTIETSWAVLSDDVTMDTDMWATDLALRGRFGMHHEANYEICLFDCTGDLDFFPTMDVPEEGFSIFRTQGGSFGIGDEEVTDAASFADFLASTLTGITAFTKAPDPLGATTLTGTRLSADGSDEWAVLDVDIDSFLRFLKVIPGLPFPPLGACLELIDYGAFDLCYETVDLDSQFRIFQDEDLSFDASVQVRVDFPTALGYHVADPGGTVTESGTAASVAFPVGHSLTVYTPASVDPLDLAPTFSLENTIERDTDLRIKYWMTNRELQLSFDMAQVSGTDSRDVDNGSNKRDCPSFKSDPVGNVECWALGLFELPGKWLKWVSNWVTDTVTKTANAINFDVGPLVVENFAETESTVPLFSNSWELGGFEDFAGQILTLDPENPIIAVSSSWEYTFPTAFTQTMLVENLGDVPLSAASVTDQLDAAGLAVNDIESFDMTVNAAYDGLGNAESLAAGQTIPVDGSATITIRWAPTPGTYSAAISAQGTSPIGTVVIADADDTMEFGWSVMDIQPDSLNRKSRGQLPVHLYGTPGFAMADIAQSSLALEGITPNKVQVEDLNLDGIPDLKLRFDRPAVIAGMDARIAALAPVVAAAQVATTATETFELQAPDFTADQVAGALLRGGGGFTQDDIFAMDRAGNGNGRLDVGDLRAAVLGGGTVLAMAKGGNGKGEGNAGGNNSGKTEEGGLGEGAPPEDFIFVLTGNMTDSTPFWAEDHAVVQGDAR